jgi:hypothetical protein
MDVVLVILKATGYFTGAIEEAAMSASSPAIVSL